jgi:hypothetical protein
MSTSPRRLQRSPSSRLARGHFAVILRCWQWDFGTLLKHFRINAAIAHKKSKPSISRSGRARATSWGLEGRRRET